ncbi:MAG: Unknown protein [uncultured Thiotrichaceae bacterium]|uniref:SPOR domain-containing protein n=1 Tax=uncultured Thiotrichaceae bacterium TaxID=298394 RepID=A0A6S6TE91_9GAMM|nr:MAG: Unknown protein [uncultured Thiotrichaceae bacterium]
MRHAIRTTLLLSSTALFAAACTNMPMEGQNTAYNTGGYNTTPAPTANVPEAGPLSATAPAVNNTPLVAANVPVATAPQNIPVATVPQVPVPAATNYNPVAATSNNNAYGTYAAAPAQTTPTYSNPPANTVVDYSQPQNTANNSYTNYGTGNAAAPTNTAAANPAVTNYYPDNTNYDTYANNNAGNNGDSYTNTGNTSASGGYNTASATGSSAIQIFASGSQAKAEQISQNIRSQGLPAVVDVVNGLYKVRVPYPDAGAARANLIRVRQASGEAGAFVTTR